MSHQKILDGYILQRTANHAAVALDSEPAIGQHYSLRASGSASGLYGFCAHGIHLGSWGAAQTEINQASCIKNGGCQSMALFGE